MRGRSKEALETYVREANSALVIVDMQEAFVGEEATVPVPDPAEVIQSVARLRDALSSLALVAWSRVTLDDWSNSVYSELWPEHFEDGKPVTLGVKTDDVEVVENLTNHIRTDDIVFDKSRYSVFWDTELLDILEQRQVENIIFCGVTTNVCVESSIRDAFHYGYRTFLVSDATGTFSEDLQETAEEVIGMTFGYVTDMNEVIGHFNNLGAESI